MTFTDRLDRRKILALLAAAPLVGARAAFAAEAQFYVVSYVEAPVAGASAVVRKLKAYAQGLRSGASAPSVEVLHEVARPQRMAVIERWATAAPEDGALQRALDGVLQAPVDRRVHRPLGALLTASGVSAFHMLMHVDVVPTGAEAATKWLDAERTVVMGARGALGFEAAIQTDRANHFAVHQTWASRAAYEAYAAGAGAQDLRKQLITVKGALFDDRFYLAS